MAGPTSEKHADRLDRLEQTLKAAIVTVSHLVTAFENENVSSARLASIKAAREALHASVVVFESLKKD